MTGGSIRHRGILLSDVPPIFGEIIQIPPIFGGTSCIVITPAE